MTLMAGSLAAAGSDSAACTDDKYGININVLPANKPDFNLLINRSQGSVS